MKIKFISKTEFHNRTNYILSLLIAFFLPVYIHIVPILIVLLSVNWIIEADFARKLDALSRRKSVWFMILLYLFYLIGMLWTENYKYGWFDLEVKLSLFVLPLVICSRETKKIKIKKILFAFVIGCLVGSIICITVAFIRWIMKSENSFDYTNLSLILHHSYFAMYVNVALSIIYIGLIEDEPLYVKRKIPFFVLAIIFISFIFLLQSKMGIISLIVQLLFLSIQITFRKRKRLLGAALTVMVALFAITAFLKIDRLSKIFYWIKQANEYKSYYKNETESTMSRIFIWDASIDILKENFFMGVGTGDVKDILLEKYKEEDMRGLYEKKLNAHSQFLQTQISIGIFGSLTLVAALLFPFFSSLKTKTNPGNTHLTLFIIIIIFNFLVESMLETQAGVIFYAFFNSLLLFSSKDE